MIVTGDGRREIVRNTDELRAWVLDIADQIRAARRQMAESIQVRQPAAKCRNCRQRRNCGHQADGHEVAARVES
jgi:CRISPR-associated exonuclease Cas4